MAKVLYITASVVPYRTRFFNLLAKECDLSVIFETGLVGYRNSIWRYSVPLKFRHHFLNHKFINKILAPLEIIFWVTRKWDVRIVGCINSKIEILAILYMRLLHIPFYLNLDGETFFEGNSLKAKIKRFIAKGAKKYLVAGRKAAENLKNAIGKADIQVYNFSSLSEAELSEHYSYSHLSSGGGKDKYALVVGAYFPYKGLDIALKAAKELPNIHFKFIGTNKRSDMLEAKRKELNAKNVEIIPFLQPEELYKCYQECSFFVLPSLQECWGLVVNEAASFGTPIISTWGSGAAVEFLSDDYPQFLAKPGDAQSLKESILAYCALSEEAKRTYSKYLSEKSRGYSIEESVTRHLVSFKKRLFEYDKCRQDQHSRCSH